MTHEEMHLEQLASSMDAVFADKKPLLFGCEECDRRYDEGFNDGLVEGERGWPKSYILTEDLPEAACNWLRDELWKHFDVLAGMSLRYDAAERKLVVSQGDREMRL